MCPLAQLPMCAYLQPQLVMHSISPRSNTLKCSILPCIDLYVPQTEEMRRFICEGRKKNYCFHMKKTYHVTFSQQNNVVNTFLPLAKTNIIWKKIEFSLCWKKLFSLSLTVLFLSHSIIYCSIITRALFYTEWALNNYC